MSVSLIGALLVQCYIQAMCLDQLSEALTIAESPNDAAGQVSRLAAR
jgi:hypothetical protein